MTQKLREVVERIGSIQLAGVNQAHEQIAGMRSAQCLVKQRVSAIEDRFLQSAFDQIVIDGAPGCDRKSVSFVQ